MVKRLVPLVLVLAVGCVAVPPDRPAREARTTVAPVAPTTVVRVSKKEACADVDAILGRMELPLQLLADGGTPVSFTDDYASGAKRFHQIGAQAPGAVAYLAEGLGGDLDRLVKALNTQQTGAAKAVGEVVTQRVVNLENACREG
ncbi:hypothetical protein ACFWHF_14405 [Streptomyces griseoincarnatus]